MTSSAPSDWYRWIPDQITAREYELLPADFCRTIEVVDGHIVKCESPSRLHNRVARRMAVQMEAARKPEPCSMVETDVDVRLSDVPLSLRRPDVVVYRRLDDEERLYADDALLVVEIVSPGSSHHTDTVEKKAAYAAAGSRSTSSCSSPSRATESSKSRSTGSPRADITSCACILADWPWTCRYPSTSLSAS
jgi:Uma2 family endonuclease